MMFPEKLVWRVDERRNMHQRRGKEWALNIRIDDHNNGWTIFAWDKKPTAKQINDAVAIMHRAMEVYHEHIQVPWFEMKVVKWR